MRPRSKISPPQTPHSSRRSRAPLKQASRAGHCWQNALASSSSAGFSANQRSEFSTRQGNGGACFDRGSSRSVPVRDVGWDSVAALITVSSSSSLGFADHHIGAKAPAGTSGVCPTPTPKAPRIGLRGAPGRMEFMDFRYLGNSGLQISEITYGNWLTHGSQVENDVATQCVHAALDAGITTFDTADAYANGKAEEVLGAALRGTRRESLEVFTKVFWPVGPDPKGKNDTGLSRKHVMESIDASLRRLQMDHVDLYQAHRYDLFTPLEETMQAFADVVRSGKALYIGVSEWRAEEIRAAKALADELHVPLVSNQPQYSALYRVIEAEVVPASRELGLSQVVWSPLGQGVLTGKYQPGQAPPEGSRATDEAGGGAKFISRLLRDDVLECVQQLRPVADEAGL